MNTAALTDSPLDATVPDAAGPDRAWRRAVIVGLCAYVVSRLCVLAGAGVRASQMVVEANTNDLPRPGSPRGLVFGVFTSWDGLWYMDIVRDGYPRSIPDNITYFQSGARAAFFPLFPMLSRGVGELGGGSEAAVLIGEPRCSPGYLHARPLRIR